METAGCYLSSRVGDIASGQELAEAIVSHVLPLDQVQPLNPSSVRSPRWRRAAESATRPGCGGSSSGRVEGCSTSTVPSFVPIGPDVTAADQRQGADHFRHPGVATLLLRPVERQDPGAGGSCGFSSTGLPIGLCLAVAWWQEPLLVRLVTVYQARTDWHLPRPPLAEEGG